MSSEHPIPLRREQPIQKAARLMAEDRVRLSDSARVYLVDGDSETYRVMADLDGIFCPCDATTPLCAHVLAVAAVRERDRPPGELSVRVGVSR